MNDALPQLPEYEPRADLWVRIQTELTRLDSDSTEELSLVMAKLPTYEPKNELWEAIRQDLKATSMRQAGKVPSHWWQKVELTAAALLVLVGSWLVFSPSATEQVRMEYTIEQPLNPLPKRPAPPPSVPQGAEAYIARQCAQQHFACQRPEVHELRNQLVELTTQQQRITHQRAVFGDDPALIRAQRKLDYQRAEVLKDLLTILRS